MLFKTYFSFTSHIFLLPGTVGQVHLAAQFQGHKFCAVMPGETAWCTVGELLEGFPTPTRQTRMKNPGKGLPWWRSGWDSACQCRGHGFEPRSGKIPHAAEQLGPWATITEPARLEPVPRNKRGRDSERPAHRDEAWPPLATTRESPRIETKTQHSQKNKIK